MPHDIIDNRGGPDESLVGHLRRMLDSAESARFAVGYFFLSGFQAVADRLAGVKELRLLIGNTTNRETLEQLAEGYRRLDLVAEAAERQAYRKRAEARQAADDTAANVRATLELMDQTDEAEAAVKGLVGMIEEKRLKVRIYTKGRMHAKAYIVDYGPVFDLFGKVKEREEAGVAVVGSSNLTLAGVTHPTELNVVVHGNDNHAALRAWFDALWDEAEDFDEALVRELGQSWAAAVVTPYELYLKALYALVRDRLEGGADGPELVADTKIERRLTDFQRRAVDVVGGMVREYGGAFAADVVGLGKSFIGAAVVKRQEAAGRRPLVVCPAPLVEMWEDYNEEYELNAVVLSAGLLTDDSDTTAALLDPDKGRYRERDFVLVDESHNFRTPGSQRYGILQRFLAAGDRACCFLTATPRNKSAWDVYHQIKLFHADDKTYIPIDPPDLRQFFRQVEQGEKELKGLLGHVLYRRRRNDIIKYWGRDVETNEKLTEAQYRDYVAGRRKAYVVVNDRREFFPRRRLETVEYSIEDTYQGLYDELRGYLGSDKRGPGVQPLTPVRDELTYARYGLWHYVKPSKQQDEPYPSLQRAGVSLRGLVRVMLFKRLESSVYAFQQTVRRMLAVHEAFLAALDEGIVPAGEEAQRLLYESDQMEEGQLMDELGKVTGRYRVGDFDGERLKAHLAHDIGLLGRMLDRVGPIGPDKDAKLQVLLQKLAGPRLKAGKRLVFTQYADTAQYLYRNLNPDEGRDDVAVVCSGDRNKAGVVRRFAPKANKDQRWRPGETELNTVVATDVLSEGLNLQDCDKIVNYDLHWNPVRLIQRFGRIDRIGSDHDEIWGFNFLPERGIERNLRLRQRLARRIAEIHETIGEDNQILDPTEQLNERAMYAMYEEGYVPDEEEDDGAINLTDAEEILRQLRRDDPALYERIKRLPDGVRSARKAEVRAGPRPAGKGTFVFCEAGAPGDAARGYQQLYLVDEAGGIVTRDVPRVLAALRCEPDEPTAPLRPGHNEAVMRARRHFAEEVKHREAELQHTTSLTRNQRYALRELRVLFGAAADDDAKARINLLERAFRGPVTTPVNRELNGLRKAGATGAGLIDGLVRIYQQHHLSEWLDRRGGRDEAPVARVVCSEALV